MKRILCSAWLVLLFGCRTTPVAGECPDNSNVPCATNRSCSEDKQRGCMVCTCDPAMSPSERPPQDRPPPEG